MEICRTRCMVYSDFASSLKPKEIIRAYTIEDLIFSSLTSLSYRDGTEFLNRCLHRTDEDSFKVRTMNDHACAVGKQYKEALHAKAEAALTEHGFSADGQTPPEDLTGVVPDPAMFNSSDPTQHFMDSILWFNECKFEEAKITDMTRVAQTEINPDECVYIFLDDVGVGRQKETRNAAEESTEKSKKKKVENTVIRVQSGKGTYSITDVGMDNALKLLLAFLIITGELMTKKLCFFSDGAKNIKDGLEKYFGFTDYTLHLDWYHLEKHLDEVLSMALRKEARDVLQPVLLSILWAGNPDEAQAYLNELKKYKNVVKNEVWLQEAIDYIGRKKPYIDCYALRKVSGYINSSNPAEKENDILVAQRQKHNGMAWSYAGSSSLAVIESAIRNEEFTSWMVTGEQRFSFRAYA